MNKRIAMVMAVAVSVGIVVMADSKWSAFKEVTTIRTNDFFSVAQPDLSTNAKIAMLNMPFDTNGAAYNATNSLGSAAFHPTSFFDLVGAGTTAAHDATNAYPWNALNLPVGGTAVAAYGVTSISTNTLPIAQIVALGQIVTGGYSAPMTFSNAVTVDAAHQFNGNGAGLTTLAAGNISSGTLADGRLSANVPLLNAANIFTAGQAVTNVSAANQNIDLGGNQAGWALADKGFSCWVGGYEMFDSAAHMKARTVAGRVIVITTSQISLDNGGQYGLSDNSAGGGDVSALNSCRLGRSASGTWLLSTNLIARGTGTFTNGVVSNSRRLLAPVSISVGGSPFNWTNSSAGGSGGTNNVYVFIDGSGVTGSVGLNGTTIFSGVTGADATVPLQPGEYVTVTYSVGTPVMFWKPF
jgi:hypothetical protein